MPRLNTKKEIGLKIKNSEERERRLKQAIQRERVRRQLFKEKRKVAPDS